MNATNRILLGACLFLFSSQLSGASPPPAAEKAKSSGQNVSSDTIVLTKCCWCKSGEQNEVTPYFGRPNCEARTATELGLSCTAVSVIGSSCALIRAVRDYGSVNMITQRLKYLDTNKQVHEIKPPEIIIPAMVYTIPLPDLYCSCQRDPKDSAKCQVTRTDHRETVTLATEKMIPGQSDCSYDECLKIFSIDKFAPRCPAYVQGTP